MGITVHINGKWYWFENAEDFIELLDENCNDTGNDQGSNMIMEYDD